MNQPPNGGYPPGAPYPGAPQQGFPQQGFPQQAQGPQQPAQPQVGQPGAAKPLMGTMLMNDAPARPGMPAQPPPQAPPPGYPQQAMPQAQLPPVAGSPGGYGQPQQAPYGAQPGYGQPQQPAMPMQYGGQPIPQQAPYGQPAAQPPYGQAPAQAPQGGIGMPQLGVGGFGAHGMPRINMAGGDFSPNKLMSAIVSGQGFNSPRKMGLIMIGLAILFGVGNFVLVFVAHRYYPYLYSVGAIFSWTGLWLLITGQPRAREDGGKAPTWSRIGLALSFGFGVLVGVAMCFLNWEAMVVSSATGN